MVLYTEKAVLILCLSRRVPEYFYRDVIMGENKL